MPVIASGGVGCARAPVEGIRIGGADAVLAASIFHYGEFSVRAGQGAAGARRHPGAAVNARSTAPSRRPTRGAAQDLPREIRIIGGSWKRSKLPVADRPGLRPTPDRVRETLFNWLGQTLAGWRCVDAFAGSGALGFEAASRGAAEVVLLERDPALVASLVATKERLQATAIRVERADALQWLARAPERARRSGLPRPAVRFAAARAGRSQRGANRWRRAGSSTSSRRRRWPRPLQRAPGSRRSARRAPAPSTSRSGAAPTSLSSRSHSSGDAIGAPRIRSIVSVITAMLLSNEPCVAWTWSSSRVLTMAGVATRPRSGLPPGQTACQRRTSASWPASH